MAANIEPDVDQARRQRLICLLYTSPDLKKVEVTGGLIGEDYLRVADNGTGNGLSLIHIYGYRPVADR